MQGLFGRFGKKRSEQPAVAPKNFQPQEVRSRSKIDEAEFPSARVFDIDDEETNWDDAETLADENNPIVYAQPIVPAVAPPPIANPTPDLDDWDEALPAATVKNSNIQEARRSKKTPPTPVSPNEDIWEDDVPSPTGSFTSSIDLDRSTPDRVEKKVGIWATMLGQVRRFLPPPLRQLSDAILTAILVILVTISIWVVDGFFVPNLAPSTAAKPPAGTVVETPTSPTAAPTTSPIVPIAPQISPEQAFIEAIQTQLSDITREYPDDLIGGLEVDIARDLAIVRLNTVWYALDTERQDRLVEKMWLQSKANHFSKLEVRDSQGVSIARSPVVGDRMIILQRTQG